MKYVRTKDRIYRLEDLLPIEISANNQVDYEKWLPNSKVTGTIEELCDEFVIIHKKQHTTFTYMSIVRKVQKETDEPIDAIYGAIWTNKGLIYAAKMNDKGELELL